MVNEYEPDEESPVGYPWHEDEQTREIRVNLACHFPHTKDLQREVAQLGEEAQAEFASMLRQCIEVAQKLRSAEAEMLAQRDSAHLYTRRHTED